MKRSALPVLLLNTAKIEGLTPSPPSSEGKLIRHLKNDSLYATRCVFRPHISVYIYKENFDHARLGTWIRKNRGLPSDAHENRRSEPEVQHNCQQRPTATQPRRICPLESSCLHQPLPPPP